MEFDGLVFVFDRKQADADRARELNVKYQKGTITEEEKQEWMAESSGALKLSDIQRNENNCRIIGGLISVPVDVKDWQPGEIPRAMDYARILGNVQKIMSGINVPGSKKLPDRPLNTYQKWNELEKIQYEIYRAYIRIKSSYQYCGSGMYAGDLLI